MRWRALSRTEQLSAVFWAAILLATTLVFWFRATIILDPDFGEHIRSGQLILQSGIPATDPFSYTMPSYHYVDHEWLFDIVVAKLYPLVGMAGLAVIVTTIMSATLVLVCSATTSTQKDRFANWPLMALVATSLLPFAEVRPPFITWFFLALLMAIAIDETRWQRWRMVLPGLFLLWANLHGGVISGIILVVALVVLRSIRLRQLAKTDIAVISLSVLATLVNPYGIALWKEIAAASSDPTLRSSIAEWQPTYFWFDPATITVAVLAGFFVWFYRRKFLLEIIGICVLFLAAGMSGIRNVPLMMIVSAPIIVLGKSWLILDIPKNQSVQRRIRLVTKIVIGYCLVLFLGQSAILIVNASQLSESNFYPKQAVAFLRENLPVGQVFSDYGWGGYLTWKFPEKKVFVNGGMPYWHLDNPQSSESVDAFKDYQNIAQGKVDPTLVFKKYGVDTALLPANKTISPALAKLVGVLTHTLNHLHLAQQLANPSLTQTLSKAGWREVYADSVAVIYTKQ